MHGTSSFPEKMTSMKWKKKKEKWRSFFRCRHSREERKCASRDKGKISRSLFLCSTQRWRRKYWCLDCYRHRRNALFPMVIEHFEFTRPIGDLIGERAESHHWRKDARRPIFGCPSWSFLNTEILTPTFLSCAMLSLLYSNCCHAKPFFGRYTCYWVTQSTNWGHRISSMRVENIYRAHSCAHFDGYLGSFPFDRWTDRSIVDQGREHLRFTD